MLVLAVFLGTGILDTLLNVADHSFKEPSFQKIFPVFCFSTAFVVGAIVSAIKRDKIEGKNLLAGVLLGIPNYFSIYFLLKSLDAFDNNGALVYPVLNIGIILLSSFLAFVLFKERLTKLNLVGVGIAVIALLLLTIK